MGVFDEEVVDDSGLALFRVFLRDGISLLL